ncbi:MAG: SAF domain-containing protein, partial [Acidimicrobiales bacterium]
MAEAAVRQRVRRPTDTSGPPPPVRRRRPLPGGRAVVGGFLVSLSAVGIFAGYRQATADDTRTYVVASSDLAVGHRIAAGDLDVVRLELPLPLRRLAYRDPGALEGATVLGPVGRGELLQSSDILVGDGPVGGGREISFAVEAARAVDGQLRTGELIDVLATFGSGADAYTVVVARRARIADRSDPVGGLTGTGEQVVTLSLP